MNAHRLSSYICTLTLVICVGLFSCGEDRTGEYLAKTEQTQWIETQMKDVYLWYDQMPELARSYYFYTPSNFFPYLLASEDNFSYLEMIDETTSSTSRLMHVDATSTYGMDYYTIQDPTGETNKLFARVLIVLPDSPADQAGIQRGDWIATINSYEVTSSNSYLLESGSGVTLTIQELTTETDEDGTETTVWDDTQTKTVTLGASVAMENNPFYLTRIFETSKGNVGYLVYNDFATGPTANDTSDQTYLEQMQEISTFFQGVDHFILDLRYNNGGYLVCAQELAYILSPAAASGKEFVYLEYNDKHQDQNVSYALKSRVGSANLDLHDLYVITGAYTASASECIIAGLRPYMNVYVVGVTTVGKNVAATQINSPYDFIMFPITATLYNSIGYSDYSDGISPNYSINELNYYPWYELGDTNEILLQNTLSLIVNGTAPDASSIDLSQPGSTDEYATSASLLQRLRPAIVADVQSY